VSDGQERAFKARADQQHPLQSGTEQTDPP
jgi:hypothetical protein